MGDGKHRPEDLVAPNRHLWRDLIKDCRSQKKARLINISSAVNEQMRAFLNAALNVSQHFLTVLVSDQRPHLHPWLITWTHLKAARFGFESFEQGILSLAHRNGHATGQAAFAAFPKGQVDTTGVVPSRSASGITIRWFLAPPAACTRLPCRA